MAIFCLLQMKEAKYGAGGEQIWLIFCFAQTEYLTPEWYNSETIEKMSVTDSYQYFMKIAQQLGGAKLGSKLYSAPKG